MPLHRVRDRITAFDLTRRASRRPGPVATYAQVLDGTGLWVCVSDVPAPQTARLALREPGVDVLHPLTLEPQPGPGDLQGVVELPTWELSSLVPVTFQLVVVQEQEVHPVRWAADAPATPTATPSAANHPWQFRVFAHEGHVGLAVQPLEPRARVHEVTVEDARFVIRFDAPESHSRRIVLHNRRGHQVGDTVPVTEGVGGLMRLEVPAAMISPGRGRLAPRLLHRDASIPLQRWHGDLRDPGAAVMLPTLDDPDDDTLIQATYLPRGDLALRRRTDGPEGW